MIRSFRLFSLSAAILVTSLLLAQIPGSHVNAVIEKPAHADPDRQADLRNGDAWQQFLQQAPGWVVEFNESSGKPHKAFGPPIATTGTTPEARALDLLGGMLAPFGVPVEELVHANTSGTSRITYVHFRQVHQGIPVIKGNSMVKLDQNGNAIAFGLEIHDDISIDLQPAITADAAIAIAVSGIPDMISTEDHGLRILPVPATGKTDHRLVHEVMVNAMHGNRPGHYLSWVDAHTGKLWFRKDQVLECGHGSEDGADAGADAQVNASIYDQDPGGTIDVVGLPELRVSVNGEFFFTDDDGGLATGIPGPVNAQVELRGRWSVVRTNNQTPSIAITLNEGANSVDFDPSANIRQRSAYYSVNRIHRRMNEVLPGFTGMDYAIPTNVDVIGGDCNAFYDGSSVNFYEQGNGCHSLASVSDVVYHEYGHGINDEFYESLGSNFSNGAMNEGYADVWAFSINHDPILAGGYMIGDPNSSIRRYDQDPKVYPVDLVGQVHADGEIIAGAWYDTYLLLGQDMELLMDLFAMAYPGLQANAFDGQEGQAYRDVLIDVLQADDDDGDITNGTPNGNAIVEGFALHGITLISNVTMQHDEVEEVEAGATIPIEADVAITFPFTNYLSGVRAFYRVSGDPTWQSVLMTNSGGITYEAQLPSQPEGSVIAYYLTLEDIFGQVSSVTPPGAAQADPNLPYFILVGAEVVLTEDGESSHELGPWSAGVPSDNATTGEWIWAEPVGSFATPGVQSSMVQPNYQHTPGGEFCWVTGNAPTTSAALGENDVDGGTTTLMSSTFDLSAYEEPIITYWRWYVNNPPSGANPNADWWQVYISNDDGSNWVKVEDTKTSDRSWRRNAVRVADLVEPSATMRLKFHASDSLRPGVELDGGSLVEAAVDDIQVWDLAGTIGIEETSSIVSNLYPDPANDRITVVTDGPIGKAIRFEVIDMMGSIVLRVDPIPGNTMSIDVSSLAEGQYVLRAIGGQASGERKFMIVR